MEHKTNYWALLLLAIILWGVVFFVKKESSIEIEMPVINIVNNHKSTTKNPAIARIGNLEMVYLKDLIIKKDENNLTIFPLLNTKVNNSEINNLTLYVSYLNDKNKNSLSVKEWLDENTDPKYPTPNSEKLMTINGIDGYYEEYLTEPNGIDYLSSFIITIKNKTDIYQVWGYKLPSTPSSILTREDINLIKKYEKIFNDILASFRFVE